MLDEDLPNRDGHPLVNISNPDIEKIMPPSILRQPSSEVLGWKNVAIERRTIMPGEARELSLKEHLLILWTSHVAEGESAHSGGRFAPYRKLPNTISTCHPGFRPAVRCSSSHEVIVAVIQNNFVLELQTEMESSTVDEWYGLQGIDDLCIRSILIILTQESEAGGPCGTLYVDALSAALATRLLHLVGTPRPSTKIPSGALPNRVLRRVTDLMRSDLSGDLSLARLASESGYSRAHFLRGFKTATGQTPHSYLLELRLQKAKHLLDEKSLTLIEVAADCGLSSHSHLTSAFRLRFGATPSQFRRRLQETKGGGMPN